MPTTYIFPMLGKKKGRDGRKGNESMRPSPPPSSPFPISQIRLPCGGRGETWAGLGKALYVASIYLGMHGHTMGQRRWGEGAKVPASTLSPVTSSGRRRRRRRPDDVIRFGRCPSQRRILLSEVSATSFGGVTLCRTSFNMPFRIIDFSLASLTTLATILLKVLSEFE